MLRPLRIAALCCTYKRPECLANVAQCFLDQDYLGPSKLFIIDDAGQHEEQDTEMIQVISTTKRYESLPLKYNALVEQAIDWKADVFAVMEDDDFFLPWHLSQINQAMNRNCRFFRLPRVYSNYALPKGCVQQEDAEGRFHSSWAFREDLMQELGGWLDVRQKDGAPDLIFDQHIGARAKRLDPRPPVGSYAPSYIYRWGNGLYHGSQAGGAGFKSLWERLGELPAPRVGPLVPRYDAEGFLLRLIQPGATVWPPIPAPNT